MLLEPGTARGGGRGHAVYYVSEKITVTSAYVKTAGVRIAVADLRGAVRCQTYSYPLIKVAGLICGIELLLAVPFAAVYGSVLMLGAGLISGFGLALAVLVDVRGNPRVQALEAYHAGGVCVLLSTRDKREFEQVRRALIRAFESKPDLG